MFFSSKTIYLLIPSPNHKHDLRIVKGQNLLITNHLDQSNNLANQEQDLNCVVAFANLSILNNFFEP
jgi:hypothetical protein